MILPETFTSGFSNEAIDQAEGMEGATVAWIREQATKLDAAVTGSVQLRTDEGVFNRLLFATPDGGLQHYDKRHLFRYANEHKRYAAGLLDIANMTPVLHVSQRYPAQRLCAAAVLPIARHPRIDSRVIVFDLDQEPDALLQLSPEAIADRLYTPSADLPEGESRVALKEVQTNRCPALIAWNHLREADFERLRIDPAAIERRFACRFGVEHHRVIGCEGRTVCPGSGRIFCAA